MWKPVDMDEKMEIYMEPVQIKARKRFLEIASEHGNARWAFEQLEWEIYVDKIDDYEKLSEEEKYALNTYMIAFRSLYK